MAYNSKFTGAQIDALLDATETMQTSKEDVANKVTSINADADDIHYPSAKAVKDKLDELAQKVDEIGVNVENQNPETNEAGFHVTDPQGNIGMQCTEEGLDFAKLSKHAIGVLSDAGIGGGGGNDDRIVNIEERCFAFVDSNLNIGVKIDKDGIHSKNILEYEVMENS